MSGIPGNEVVIIKYTCPDSPFDGPGSKIPPSARISSRSSVAPPVIIVRMRVNASELKYVAETSESRTEIAKAVPQANGWVR